MSRVSAVKWTQPPRERLWAPPSGGILAGRPAGSACTGASCPLAATACRAWRRNKYLAALSCVRVSDSR